MKRYFEFRDSKSYKFWQIEIEETSFTVTYGKIGTAGQTKEGTFDSEEKTQKEITKLIGEKTKKGYVEKVEASSKKISKRGYIISLDEGKTYNEMHSAHFDIQEELDKYWDNLVPPSGDAKTVQGQFGCIIYRFTNEYWRNGLMNWVHQVADDDYRYRGMVEFLDDRLVAEKPFEPDATAFLADILKQLFYQSYPANIDIFQASDFETIIECLECAIYAYYKKFPELIPNDEPEKCEVAKSQDIDQEALEKLASDVSSKVRSVVASNPLCSVDTLIKLSADHSVQVRLAVAKHEKSPINVIEKLSKDENVNVRCAAARRKDFSVTKQHDFISAQFAPPLAGQNPPVMATSKSPTPMPV